MQGGLRWSVDTDRANQDVATPLCSQVDPSLQFDGCTGNTPLFDQYGVGNGGKTHQPYGNFGPQLGFVFSPGSHKFAIRGGSGIFYESNLFNNTGNARSSVITAQGQYFNYGAAVYNSSTISLPGFAAVTGLDSNGTPCSPGAGGCFSVAQVFAMSVAQASKIMNGLKTQYDAVSAVPAPNSSFIGTGGGLYANNIYGKKYLSPYSIQFNGGVQYEVAKGMTVSADYVHNATLKVPTTVDTNHVGAARYLNVAAAQNAIAATTASFNCAGGYSAAAIDCAIGAGAIIDDFAGNGLDGAAYLGGPSASYFGLTPTTGAAFGGQNPNVGQGRFILPVGKSGYDALQIVMQEQKAHPLPGIVSSNMQVSYNFSRIITTATSSDQFFAGAGAYNQDNVTEYMGRNGLDRTQQLSLGGSLTVKYGVMVGLTGHFYSAPPSTLTLPTTTGAGQIFKTDVDGDGTTGDLVPGTNPGAYMHEIRGSGLNNLISQYNATQAGTLTPAGKALASAGLISASQLTALGATQIPLGNAAPANPLKNAAFRGMDVNVAYPIRLSKFREGLSIVPGVAMYNVFNMSNFGAFGTLTTAADAGSASDGTLSGANNQGNLEINRTGRGTGTFDAGGPRSTEFNLKVNF